MASRKWVRGMKAIFADVTNQASCESVISPCKRSCASSASTRIKSQSKRYAARGSTSPKTRNSPRNVGDGEVHAIQQLMMHRQHVIQGGMECIQGYIKRNASFPLQKAFALRIFSQCISSGCKIESSEFAAACTGYCSRSIRRWTFDFFGDYFLNVTNIDDVIDEKLEKQLESGTGRHP